jgi:hypothetical protein
LTKLQKFSEHFSSYWIIFFCLQFIVTSQFIIFFLKNYEFSLASIVYSCLELSLVLTGLFLVTKIFLKKLVFFLPLAALLLVQFWGLQGAITNITTPELMLLIVFVWMLLVLLLWKQEFHELKNFNLVLTSIILLGSTVEVSNIFIKKFNFDNKLKLINEEKIIQTSNKTKFPNIIYIVPDRYGGKKQLEEYFNFDNSKFFNDLRARGFLVANQSRSNYPKTHASLASTLNSSYLSEINQSETASFHHIKNSYAFKQLTSLNYAFINYDNWWLGSQDIKLADTNYFRRDSLISSITYNFIYFNTPIIQSIAKVFPSTNQYSSCKSEIKKLEDLKRKVTSKSNNLFIFAHLLMPHEPYLIDSKGECLSQKIKNENQRKNNYLEYLKYFNMKILEIFNEAKKNNEELIFIIQSDEGPHPECYRNGLKCTSSDWDLKTSTLNAIYISQPNKLTENDLYTPINNFLYIFEHLELNEIEQKYAAHKVFIPQDKKNEYRFKEVKFIDKK